MYEKYIVGALAAAEAEEQAFAMEAEQGAEPRHRPRRMQSKSLRAVAIEDKIKKSSNQGR